jgi:DNA topoisomerase-6 subunit B
LKRTAVANPHAKIILVDPEGSRVVFDRTSSKIPPRPQPMLPHPLGVTADDVKVLAHKTNARRLGSFLEAEFCRISSQKVKEIEVASKVDMDINPHNLTHADAEKLVRTFKEIKFIAPPTEGLVAIGEKQLEDSMKARFKPEFLAAISRTPSVYRGGIPFQIEAGISYGGESGRKMDAGVKAEIMRFANKSPLLFDEGGCSITKAVRDIDWKRYEIDNFDNATLTVVVSLISPWVPYTSAGKQAIADDEDIIKELRLAIMECGRKLQLHLGAVRRADLARKRESIFSRYIGEISGAISSLTKVSKDVVEKKFGDFVRSKVASGNFIEDQVDIESTLGDEKGDGGD